MMMIVSSIYHRNVLAKTVLVTAAALFQLMASGRNGTQGFTLPTTTTPTSSSFLSSRNSFGHDVCHNKKNASTPLPLRAAFLYNDNDDDDNTEIPSSLSSHPNNDHLPLAKTTTTATTTATSSASILLLTTLSSSFIPLAAHAAAGPDWGIFEGRTGSLLHPLAMFGMVGLSVSTAILGYQWRRQRTLGEEITELKKTLPTLKDGATSVKAALALATTATTTTTTTGGEDNDKDANNNKTYIRALQNALETETQVEALVQERKELASANPREKHYNQGSLLLFLGIAFAIEGPLNTYARAGKLFPGPHLYAGAGLVVLWSLAASMVPYMQKGNDTARTVHIGANAVGLGLLLWQVTTGVPILLKVVELTKWP